jgi:hypothetical protein
MPNNDNYICRLTNFKECCMQVPELGKYMENGINIDPIPLTMEQFAVAGDMDGKVRHIYNLSVDYACMYVQTHEIMNICLVD